MISQNPSLPEDAPSVAIIGRPNVGKSLLFNRLCGRRAALVHDMPGMTLDYLCETITVAPGCAARLMDTGGVQGEETEWSDAILQRMMNAAQQADILLVVMDAAAGIQHGDRELLAMVRRRWPSRPRLLLANKSEGMTAAAACADFYALKEEMIPVSAKRGGGLAALRNAIAEMLPREKSAASPGDPLAIIGRPNVGKSTLMNRILNEDRVLVSATPGTTRDNVCARLCAPDGDFVLIDTAGMRRHRADSVREKFSVAAARDTLQRAAAVFFVWDIAAGPTYQDRKIAALIAAAGCGVVMLGNKSDLLPAARRAAILRQQVAELHAGCEARAFAISATGGHFPAATLLRAAAKSVGVAQSRFSTARLNRALSEVVSRNPPPMTGGIRPKLRYIHQGGQSPLRFVIHGGGVSRIAGDYRRYLSSALARKLSIVGAPLLVDFRAENNPYV